MKTKLLFFFLLLFCTAKSFAQAYVPLLNNSEWAVTVYYFGGSDTFTISQSGEVTVGAVTYKKFTTLTGAEFLIREDSAAKRVYKYVDGSEVLLFDFSLQVSDTIFLGNGQLYTVTTISNVNVNGGQRRRLTLTSANAPFSEVWIEGVGSTQLPLSASYELFSDPVYYLKCSFQNGVNVYNQGIANGGAASDCLALGVNEEHYLTKKIDFSPNPFQHELVISTDSSFMNMSLKMYNSLGQLVKAIDHLNGGTVTLAREQLSNGIYLIQLVENGRVMTSKKVVIN